MSLDYAKISQEFLRAVRGKRSQVAFSRRLGFASNVAAEWESGRRVPAATTALRACERAGIRVQPAFAAFRPSTKLKQLGGLEPARLAAWLQAQQGDRSATALAQQAGLSRHQVSRYLSGRCQPRLHEFFALVQAQSGRLSDLIAGLVDIDAVPSLRAYHARVVASRTLAFDEPWSSAVLPLLECLGALPRAQASARIARALALPESDVTRCLERLERAGVLARRQGQYALSHPLVVDTTAMPDAGARLRRHWAAVGAERSAQPSARDVFSYNVFSVSRADLEHIAQLQREHFQRVRAIIASSAPETVALVNLQLVELAPAP